MKYKQFLMSFLIIFISNVVCSASQQEGLSNTVLSFQSEPRKPEAIDKEIDNSFNVQQLTEKNYRLRWDNEQLRWDNEQLSLSLKGVEQEFHNIIKENQEELIQMKKDYKAKKEKYKQKLANTQEKHTRNLVTCCIVTSVGTLGVAWLFNKFCTLTNSNNRQ